VRYSRVRPVVLLVSLGGLTSCGGSDGTGPETPVAASITLSSTSVELSFLGATFALGATVRDQNGQAFAGTVTWTIDNAGVASVDNAGLVTAIDNGTATVSASSGNATATVPVTVEQTVTSIGIVSGSDQSATVGQALAEAIVLQANDGGGAPVAGAAMEFEPTSGEASPSSAVTDAQGQASVDWTLGTSSGQQQLRASIEGSSVSTQISATALADAAAAFVKFAGDAQVGPVDLALADPIVVQLQDRFGNGVPGGEVTFSVTAGGGSVTPAIVATGEDGTAQTSWTMGSAIDAAGLDASTPGFPTLAFTANSVAAQPDLVVSAITVNPAAPTTLETVSVTASVTNDGTAPTVGSFAVRLMVDGAEVGSQTTGPTPVGATADVAFTAGPFDAGVRALSVEVDPDGVISESDEGNNTSVQSVAVATQTTLEVGVPLSNVGATEGVELLYAFELTAEAGSIAFKLSGGSGDADMYVNRGHRPSRENSLDWDCISGAIDSNEECRINAALPGTYHVLIHAFTTFSGTTLEVVTGLEVLPFNIDISYINSGTASQRAAFTAAANRYENVIPFDITDIPFENFPIDADECIEGQPEITDVVDDLRIYVDFVAIDGPAGTLAQAGPCLIRSASGLPIIGFMQFDTDDMANLESGGRLTDVVLHEMAHVLGLGSIWNLNPQDFPDHQFLEDPSIETAGADTHFTGPLAIEAFDDAGGTNYTGAKVPVENSGEEGSADAHWRESVLRRELMTPGLNSGTNPLSAISIQSLADIGYRVDVTQADSYQVVFPAAGRVTEQQDLPVINLRGDVVKRPLLEVNALGKVVRVIRR
jgi:hypothetical protein